MKTIDEQFKDDDFIKITDNKDELVYNNPHHPKANIIFNKRKKFIKMDFGTGVPYRRLNLIMAKCKELNWDEQN